MISTAAQKELAALVEKRGIVVPELGRSRTPPAPRAKKRLPPRLQEAAAEALAAFRASPQFRALIADIPTLDLRALQSRLDETLNGPHFAPLLARLRAPATFEESPDDLVPKALSIGLMAQAVVLVGLSGSVGYVINLDRSNPKTGIYLGGAIDCGIDAGIEGDVCLGFWANAVDDINGVYVGEEVDIDDTTGVTEAAFVSFESDDLALVFVGLDLGIDDGMEEVNFYFVAMGFGHAPIYQSGDATYLVQLGTLTCSNSKDNYDTVYLNYTQDSSSTQYRYPVWDGIQMAEQGNDARFYQWGVGQIVKFNTELYLILQVGDHTMPTQKIQPGTTSLTFSDKVNGVDDIEYTLDVQFLKT